MSEAERNGTLAATKSAVESRLGWTFGDISGQSRPQQQLLRILDAGSSNANSTVKALEVTTNHLSLGSKGDIRSSTTEGAASYAAEGTLAGEATVDSVSLAEGA